MDKENIKPERSNPGLLGRSNYEDFKRLYDIDKIFEELNSGDLYNPLNKRKENIDQGRVYSDPRRTEFDPNNDPDKIDSVPRRIVDIGRNLEITEIPKFNLKNNIGLSKFENNKNIKNNIGLSKFENNKFENNKNIKNNIGLSKFENIFFNNIYSTSAPNLYKSLNKIKASPLGINLNLDSDVSVNADNIGEFALPIVEYIRQTKPDYVVACDRGARLLGLAVFRLHNLLYGRFPTADGTLRFRRFSKSNSQDETEEATRPLVDEMLASNDNPSVLVLDDWVCSGGTKNLVERVFDNLSDGRISTRFGVLIGGKADVSGHKASPSGFVSATDWRDDSNIIGVSYAKSGVKPKPVITDQSLDYRRRMYAGIAKLVERLKQDKSEAA